MRCPKCKTENNQNKDGYTNAGSQRYRCKECGARYTPEKKQQGYDKRIRELALQMHAGGMNFQQIGQHLKVSNKSVMNWVKANAEKLSEASVPKKKLHSCDE